MSDINVTLLIKTLVFSSVLICTLLSAQAQAGPGSCKVDLFRLNQVEVRKPAKALDETGTKVLSTAISTVITAGAGKVVQSGFKSATTGYRLAVTKKIGEQGFVVGNKVIEKAADKAIDLGISELITLFDDKIRTPDDLIVRFGGSIAVDKITMPEANGFLDTISPGYEGSFIGSFNLQLIEYDSGSANDDLGTVYGEDQNLLFGQLPPINNENLEILSSAEDSSHYRVDYEIITGAGNLDDIPERLFCNTGECIDARENFPSDYYFEYPKLSDMKGCPAGYKDAGGTYHGDGSPGSFGPWYRVCELHPNCGSPFKRLKDIPGGVAALQDGDIIVLRGRTSFRTPVNGPNSDEQDYYPDDWYRYLSNSNGNGQYLGVCTDCTNGLSTDAIGSPNAGLYYIDRDKSAAQWTVKKFPDGKIALQGSNKKYLSRCQGCSAKGRQDAFVHVTDPSGPYAQFTIQESPSPSGDFIYTLRSDLGGYLSGCFGCVKPYKLGYGYSANLESSDPSGYFSKWSIGVQQTDWDSDGDGTVDKDDAFPTVASETNDTDGDGVGDNADVFPNDASETKDTDGDGVGDHADAFPNDASETKDTDGDGVGDNVDVDPYDPDVKRDSDGDNLPDYYDPCPDDPLGTIDSDGDGVCDYIDAYPIDPSESVDSDGDGVGDNRDGCPNDASGAVDSDGDRTCDNSDAYPYDSNNLTHIEIDNSNGWVIESADYWYPYDEFVPDGFTFPEYLARFRLTGGVSGSTANVTFIYPNPLDPELVWLKTNCPDEDCVGSFYITNNSLTIDGNRVTVTIKDGGVSDEDHYADGTITNNALSGPAILTGTIILPAYDTIEQDWDSDRDGVFDKSDAFPYDANETKDSDSDGVGDNADYCPNDPSGTTDADNDGVCDIIDSDGDGIGDYNDVFPYDANETKDSDSDGVGDNGDVYPYDPDNLRLLEINSSNGWSVAEALFVAPNVLNAPLPSGVMLPNGMVQFRLTGGSIGTDATITITYPEPLDPQSVWWKYGTTTSNNTPRWYVFDGAVISGNTVTLTITDGGVGDDDHSVNGSITDPGGPGNVQTVTTTNSGSGGGGALNIWYLIILWSITLLKLKK